MMNENYLEDTHNEAVKMIKSGAEKSTILSYLASAAEKASVAGAVSSILVLDSEGRLRNGGSPKLPADYLKAIDGLKPNAYVGTCAAAAATGSVVITPDFRADGKWDELRHLPLALGFTGAWSMPIKSPEGKVLGTFGTYFREQREPTVQEIKGVEYLARTASMVISAS